MVTLQEVVWKWLEQRTSVSSSRASRREAASPWRSISAAAADGRFAGRQILTSVLLNQSQADGQEPDVAKDHPGPHSRLLVLQVLCRSLDSAARVTDSFHLICASSGMRRSLRNTPPQLLQMRAPPPPPPSHCGCSTNHSGDGRWSLASAKKKKMKDLGCI